MNGSVDKSTVFYPNEYFTNFLYDRLIYAHKIDRVSGIRRRIVIRHVTLIENFTIIEFPKSGYKYLKLFFLIWF